MIRLAFRTLQWCKRARGPVVISLVLALVLSGTVLAQGEKPAGFNVLFIAVDDMRPELGCYGFDYMHTPNIDRLASRGTLFERRGVTYNSAIDQVVRDLENVIVRAVDFKDDRITLAYALKLPAHVQLGMGIGRSSMGLGVLAGTLVIDSRTHTLLEHRSERLTERLTRYVEIRDGYYVPLRISINRRERETDHHLFCRDRGMACQYVHRAPHLGSDSAGRGQQPSGDVEAADRALPRSQRHGTEYHRRRPAGHDLSNAARPVDPRRGVAARLCWLRSYRVHVTRPLHRWTERTSTVPSAR